MSTVASCGDAGSSHRRPRTRHHAPKYYFLFLFLPLDVGFSHLLCNCLVYSFWAHRNFWYCDIIRDGGKWRRIGDGHKTPRNNCSISIRFCFFSIWIVIGFYTHKKITFTFEYNARTVYDSESIIWVKTEIKKKNTCVNIRRIRSLIRDNPTTELILSKSSTSHGHLFWSYDISLTRCS